MGLSINIAVSDKYAGTVNYGAAKEICGKHLYKMGSDFIGIEDAPSLDFDKVVVKVGHRQESLLFDMVSTIRMQSNSREKNKTIKVKPVSEKDGAGKEFTIYKMA